MSVNSKILIIEDDENKLQNIMVLIQSELKSTKISVARSVKSAISKIDEEQFDLIFADMSLPTYEIQPHESGGTPRPFGGVEVFDYLEMSDILVPIIVITSYPKLTDGTKSLNVRDLEKQLLLDYPQNFIGLVYFDTSVTDWESTVKSLINITMKE